MVTVRQLPGCPGCARQLFCGFSRSKSQAVVFKAPAQNAQLPELVEVLRRPRTVPRRRPQVLPRQRQLEATAREELSVAMETAPVAGRSASAAGRDMAGLNRPMREAWAAARRSRKGGAGCCARCGVPLLAAARQQGAHGRGGPCRRLPAAGQELLRQPRAPRGPSR